MSIIEYRLQHFTAIILPLRLPLVRGFNRCQCFANIIICQVFQAMLRHPLVHHGAPWYAMSGEGLVIHLGQLTPDTSCRVSNGECIVPDVSSRVRPFSQWSVPRSRANTPHLATNSRGKSPRCSTAQSQPGSEQRSCW